VWTVLGGGLMEKQYTPSKGKSPHARRRLPECTVSDGLWKEWKMESGKTKTVIEVIEAIET
jgi:hypothetical protein